VDSSYAAASSSTASGVSPPLNIARKSERNRPNLALLRPSPGFQQKLAFSAGKRSAQAEKVVKKRRHAPGIMVLREIRRLQNSTQLLIPKAPFYRLIREITRKIGEADLRFQSAALSAIQVRDPLSKPKSLNYKIISQMELNGHLNLSLNG
jgi:hypothetical protein